MLNENELKVLQAIANEIIACTAGEFGYPDDVQIDGTKKQKAGYFSQLSQKGMIGIDEDFGSIFLTEVGLDTLRKSGETRNFSTIG